MSKYWKGTVLALIFIGLTFIGSESDINALRDICFIFHLLPFGFLYAGGTGSTLLTIGYYLILFSLLTITFTMIISTFRGRVRVKDKDGLPN